MFKNNYNDYYYNNPILLDNIIKVSKKEYIKNSEYSNFQNPNPKISFKDGLYYSLEKKYKKSNNKNNLSFNINNIAIVANENNKNTIKLCKPDAFKKTININSNQNQGKEGNIIEELQNNKYLRPMLGTNNIDIKLLKCQIDEPIKNINNFSFQKYINKHKIPIKNSSQLSQKDKDRLQSEDKINTYDFNNKSVMEKTNSNIDISSINKISKLNDNNNNSFIDLKDTKNIKKNNFKYLLKNSPTNLKKYSAIPYGKIPNGKKLFKENKRDKYNSQINSYENEINIKYNSMNTKSNLIRGKSHKNSEKEKKNNISKDDKMFNIYKKKLVEEFIIVLDKFISKHLNKKKCIFFKNFMKFNRKPKSKKKIYYRKNNNKFSKNNLALTCKNNEIKRNNLFNIEIDKEKELEKIKTKVITTDTSNNNFNLNNKSFSNEIKSSNLLSNNKFNNHSSSYLFIDQKHKNYSQSPESTLNKNQIKQIKTKTIIYKNLNLNSGSPSRSSSGGRGDTFVYKKKNLNNDNISINNKNNINKYSNKINKKDKIIGIDINLGKPIRIINDHSPLEEFYLERNEPYLFPLNIISNDFIQTKKNKKNSRTKKKNKPPLQIKKFANEDDENEDFFNNFYIDSYKGSSTLKIDEEKNYINMHFENSLREKNSNLINKSIFDTNIDKKENIIGKSSVYIRTNSFYFYDYKNKNNDSFKSWNIEKNMSLFLLNHKNNEQNKNNDKSDNKKAINKLYINCTKFFVKILKRLFKKRLFAYIKKLNKNKQ